jgi:hypothetical protein
MNLKLHHIFICTSAGAPEAQFLLNAGLVEGSGKTHPGQGTANRRFFFDSGYLELLWVHDEREARSELTAPTKLWERWAGRDGEANPFGLCFSSAQGVDPDPPFPAWQYRPAYLPDGRCFYFGHHMRLSEPEVFALGWPQDQSPPAAEPTHHSLGLGKMRFVSVGLAEPDALSGTLREIRDAGLIASHHSVSPELVIEFTSRWPIRRDFPEMGITLIGQPRHT